MSWELQRRDSWEVYGFTYRYSQRIVPGKTMVAKYRIWISHGSGVGLPLEEPYWKIVHARVPKRKIFRVCPHCLRRLLSKMSHNDGFHFHCRYGFILDNFPNMKIETPLRDALMKPKPLPLQDAIESFKKAVNWYIDAKYAWPLKWTGENLQSYRIGEKIRGRRN